MFDLPADVVRQTAVGEGHVLAAFQHDDLGVVIEASGTGGATHAPGDTADDHEAGWGIRR